MRLHKEGNKILLSIGTILALIYIACYYFCQIQWISYTIIAITIIPFLGIVNFFRCPCRIFQGEKKGTVVSSADGKVVVIEEVEENSYFHDRRIQVSVFMSVFNVHANWYPVAGKVKHVSHQDGRYLAAYLPKSSTDNERSTVVIETPEGHEILVRQIAGALARRIVTYAKEGENCCFDQHLGFIKFGSRVDLFLPLGSKVKVENNQLVTANETVIATLPK